METTVVSVRSHNSNQHSTKIKTTNSKSLVIIINTKTETALLTRTAIIKSKKSITNRKHPPYNSIRKGMPRSQPKHQ